MRQTVKEFNQKYYSRKYHVDQLRTEVAELIEVEPDEIALGDDLIEWGLDSIRLMSLINLWQTRGVSREIR